MLDFFFVSRSISKYCVMISLWCMKLCSSSVVWLNVASYYVSSYLFVSVTVSIFIHRKGEYLLHFYLCDYFISFYLIVFWLAFDVILSEVAN